MDIEECIFVGIVCSYGSSPDTVIVRRPDKDDRTTAELRQKQSSPASCRLRMPFPLQDREREEKLSISIPTA